MPRRVTVAIAIVFLGLALIARGQVQWKPDYTAWDAWLRERGFEVGRQRYSDDQTVEARIDSQPGPEIRITGHMVWVTEWPTPAAAAARAAEIDKEFRGVGMGGSSHLTLGDNMTGTIWVRNVMEDVDSGKRAGLLMLERPNGKAGGLLVRENLTAEFLLQLEDTQAAALNEWNDGWAEEKRKAMLQLRNEHLTRYREPAARAAVGFLRELAAFEPAEVSPIVFVHGIGGSQLLSSHTLANLEVWPLAPVASRTALMLEPDGSAPAGVAITPGRIIDNVGFWSDVYRPVQAFLEKEFRAEGHKYLEYFSYDWRLDNTRHVLALARNVDQVLAATGKKKVNLVTHSMGGLIAKAYVQSAGAAKVNKLITIAGPFRGGPFVFQAIADGYNFDNDTVRPELMKILAQNWPAVYQIYPRTPFVLNLSDRTWLSPAESRTIRFRGFAGTQEQWFTLGEGDHYTETPGPAWSYNATLAADADRFHALISDGAGAIKPPPGGVKHYVIVGCGVPTIKMYVLYPAGATAAREYKGRPVTLSPATQDGDGKVPIGSADIGAAATRSFFIKDATAGGTGPAGHSSILGNPELHSLLAALLRNKPVDKKLHERPTPAFSNGISTGLLLVNRSAVTLTITNPATGGTLSAAQDKLAGGLFTRVDGAEHAWLPAGAAEYRVALQGIRSGSFTLSVAGWDAGKPVAFSFPATEVTAESRGELIISERHVKAAQIPTLMLKTGGRTVQLTAQRADPIAVSAALRTDLPDPPVVPETGPPSAITEPGVHKNEPPPVAASPTPAATPLPANPPWISAPPSALRLMAPPVGSVAFQVEFQGLPTLPKSWIALYRAGANERDYLTYLPTNQKASGQMSFPGQPAGPYELRVFSDDGTRSIPSLAFQIGAAPAGGSLGGSPTTPAAGGQAVTPPVLVPPTTVGPAATAPTESNSAKIASALAIVAGNMANAAVQSRSGVRVSTVGALEASGNGLRVALAGAPVFGAPITVNYSGAMALDVITITPPHYPPTQFGYWAYTTPGSGQVTFNYDLPGRYEVRVVRAYYGIMLRLPFDVPPPAPR